MAIWWYARILIEHAVKSVLIFNYILTRRVQSFGFNQQEEEQAVKPRNAKRRRKANTTVDSDSDE